MHRPGLEHGKSQEPSKVGSTTEMLDALYGGAKPPYPEQAPCKLLGESNLT